MEHKILSIKKGNEWTNSFGTFQSYTLSLEGHGEPVGLNKKVPVTNEPQVGDVLYGNIEVKTTKTGMEYSSFKAEKRPEGELPPANQVSSWSENPERQDAINRSVALNNATSIYHGTGGDITVDTNDVTILADKFYAWLKGDPIVDPFPTDEEDHSND